jgi:hypothetical protein
MDIYKRANRFAGLKENLTGPKTPITCIARVNGFVFYVFQVKAISLATIMTFNQQ